MKIILSRKGFDSANGGIVSPIMEDGTLISFPIPSDDNDTYDVLTYGGQTYTKILEGLIEAASPPSAKLTYSSQLKPIKCFTPKYSYLSALTVTIILTDKTSDLTRPVILTT